MQVKNKFALCLTLSVFLCAMAYAQKKQMWAKSYLNQKAPSIASVTWITDQPDTKGKFILIDFWATWCKPCKEAIPDMNRYSKMFKDNLIVIGISNESEAKVKSMTSPKMNYFSALDADLSINKIYEIQGIPHVVLIDPDGIVRWEGFPHLTGQELTAKVIKDIIETYNP